ncbi:SGNH/GDSL hydrolase family protein [Promicromonospora sukumoe]|uniref:SGNH/GDSL hydrolase family protein n=1 Tax=Promicromonospora sukumoe TaxID=88382 RepID=UPI0037CB04B8
MSDTLKAPAPAATTGSPQRRWRRRLIAVIATLLAAALLVSVTVLMQAFILKPANGPDAFRDAPASDSLIVVAGASTVQGTISADWVSGLYEPGTDVVNAGINGHTTADLLERLDRDVIELDPERVITLVGTNDIRGDVDPAQSQENISQILDQLTTQTSADVAVMSLQPLGEQLDSDQNTRIRAYNAMLKSEAEARGVDYLPLYESLEPLLDGDAPDFSFPIIQTAFDKFLFGKTFTEMSESHGLQVTADNVHLNERGAAVAGRLAAEWMEQTR